MKFFIFVIFLLAPGVVLAQPYIYTQIDVPGASSTRPTGINNRGEMVGNFVDAGGTQHGFVRSPDGTYTTLDYPGSLPGTTVANGINNLGATVGSYQDANGTHPWIRGDDGVFTTFSIPAIGPGGGANAINDRGEIAGSVYDFGFVGQGFLRSADGSTLTLIQGSPFSNARPTAINNNDEIVGVGIVGGSGGTRHGFIAKPDGSVTQFDLPGTDNLTQLGGVNSLGQLAGYRGTLGFVQATDGTFALLDGYEATAINDSGRIVGVRVESNGATLHGFVGTPGNAPTQPVIRTLLPGVITASGFGGATSISPGSWIEIYGQNFAGRAREWRTSDFTGSAAPTSLDGVKVSINGIPAYVSYISPGQVNAQVPDAVAAGSAQVTVSSGTQTSAPYTVTVNAFQPSMLALPHTTTPFGQYLGAVLPDFVTYLLPPGYTTAVPTRRARPGDTIVLFGIGFGPVTPGVPAGQVAAQSSLMAAQPVVTIGGLPATVTYAGSVAGVVGLYQINVVVPNVTPALGLPFSDFTPVTIQVNGVTLPTATTPAASLYIPFATQ